MFLLPSVISYQTRFLRPLFRPTKHPIAPRTCPLFAGRAPFRERNSYDQATGLSAKWWASTWESRQESAVPSTRVPTREHWFASSFELEKSHFFTLSESFPWSCSRVQFVNGPKPCRSLLCVWPFFHLWGRWWRRCWRSFWGLTLSFHSFSSPNP